MSNADPWKKRLTAEQYRVLRLKGTEPPFSGEYVTHFEDGTYHCVACGAELFDSSTKFETDCGWPSFFESRKDVLITRDDNTFGMHRIEVLCARCESHLGHVFDDAPNQPTGLRYCINSVALNFQPSPTKSLITSKRIIQ